MELNKLKENDLLNFLNHDFYFIVINDGFYFVDHSGYSPVNYNVNNFTNLLRLEERKFLIAECIMNSFELYEFFNDLYAFSDQENLGNFIRTLNEEEINKIISVLRYTQDFNGYLCYLLNDWKEECFDSEEEYLNYTY